MSEYRFLTYWRIDRPVEEVWEAILGVQRWPEWWRYVERVEELRRGDKNGLGALRRFTWRSRLPYRLSFEMEVTRVVRHSLLEGRARGELDGTGRWSFIYDGNCTDIHYEWTVRSTKVWMNLLAPLARPAFVWNHDGVMREGGEGLARHLGGKLLAHSNS